MARDFDIVIYGATGYTGRLVAEHFLREYGDRPDAPTWAMAGRNPDKLAEVKREICAPDSTPTIVADAADATSLAQMCEQAKVIIATVGPYQLYGEPLLAACAKSGTHYADLCGEPAWMRQMIDKYDADAKASGARISFSSGFDSIPFDLGVLMLQKEAQERFGAPCKTVRGRVRAMKGTFSGGTAASLTESLKAMARDPSLIPIMRSPFGLTPGFDGPDQPGGMVPKYESDLGKWAAPFVMAPINTKNVHRTNFLLGHPYGEDFRYDEMVLTSPGEAGKAAANAAAEMIKNPFGAKPPKPGEGPSPEERENGYYDVLFVGETSGGEVLRYAVKGRYDPGYGSTSRMIGETGIALTESDAPGGIGTPGSILGEALVARLRDHAELTFAVEE